MKAALFFLLAIICVGSSCHNPKAAADTGSAAVSGWKLGSALWTFHTFDFPAALDKIDSAGLKYIEPNTFQNAGTALGDSSIGKLSPAGIRQLKTLVAQKGLSVESVYIAGDSTVSSWVKQFEIAKGFGVKYVTAEPPEALWDSIDSLAGAYGMKLAIHEHWKGVSHYWNPDTVLLAIKGHPNFGACADLGHWPKSGINPVDAVKKLAGHIFTVHLKDIAAYNDPTLKDVPAGTGIVDMPAVFQELKNQGFDGRIFIERDAEDLPSNLPSVIQTVKYYNETVSKLK